MERVKIGIPGLDEMLNGGLPPKRPYVITGAIGSGKTTLGVQFLIEGVKENESVLMVALDEPPNEVKENMQSFGWDLSNIRILDATPDVKAYSKTHAVKELAQKMDVSMFNDVKEIRKSSQQRTMEISIYSVQQMLKQEIKDYKEVTGNTYKRLVIDSMTALKIFGMKGFDMRTAVQSFFRFLSELEITALILIDSSSQTNELDTDILLARGEIKLNKWREADEIKRAVMLEKIRGTDHDMHMRPFRITDEGIIVDKDKEVTSEEEEEGSEEETETQAQAPKVEAKKKFVRKVKAKSPSAGRMARRRDRDLTLAERTYKETRTL